MYFYKEDLINMIVPDKPDPQAARVMQEVLGGRFGEMRTMMQFFFQSNNFRGNALQYRDLIRGIFLEELSHVELVHQSAGDVGRRLGQVVPGAELRHQQIPGMPEIRGYGLSQRPIFTTPNSISGWTTLEWPRSSAEPPRAETAETFASFLRRKHTPCPSCPNCRTNTARGCTISTLKQRQPCRESRQGCFSPFLQDPFHRCRAAFTANLPLCRQCLALPIRLKAMA